MPAKSKAQNRFMHAVAEGKVKDVPKSVGKEYVNAQHGHPVKNLPERAKKRK